MTSSNNAYPPASYIRERFDGFERDVKSLTAHIQRLETNLGERITATDSARATGNDSMHDLITRTANAIYTEVKKLEQRISDCELAVGTDKLADDPKPPVDTSWHPYDVETEYLTHPTGDKRVVVMDRNGEFSLPKLADWCDWLEAGNFTIVAWRYANEWE